jgi:hypothetical protein
MVWVNPLRRSQAPEPDFHKKVSFPFEALSILAPGKREV